MNITVKIHRNDRSTPKGKLADAEVHFLDGELAGLKLVGFAVWGRREGTGQNVTFPSRHFDVHGDRRSFTLLRPIDDPNAQRQIRAIVLDAYATHIGGTAETVM
jgi:hypothetical protein